jgi:dihydrofolate reductase
MATLSLIAALGAHTRVIGAAGRLLWRIPEDLVRFKTLTLGHPIIMGRKTFDSIGRPLPGRTNIVVTRNTAWTHEGVTVAHTVDEALAHARTIDTEEIFVIGGGELYTQTIDRADRLYLTLIEDDTPGDTYFPTYENTHVRTTLEVPKQRGSLHYQFSTYERT